MTRSVQSLAVEHINEASGGVERLDDTLARLNNSATPILLDSVGLPSQSDDTKVRLAIDRAVANLANGSGSARIQFEPRNHVLDQIDISDLNNVEFLGYNASDYGQVTTTWTYDGGSGSVPFIMSNPTNLNAGIQFKGLLLNGGGLASRVMQIIAGTNWTIENLRCIGATDEQVFMDGSENYGCGQLSRFVHWDISCTGQPSSSGLVMGPGQTDQDCYGMTFDQLRIIHYDGIGLDIGAADTIMFRQLLVQRPSGTGWSIRHKGGDAPGSNINQSYEIVYDNYFAGGEIVLEAGPNPASGINFLTNAAQSGSSVPQFLGASSGSYTDHHGLVLTRYANGSYNHTTLDGRVRLYDATPGAEDYRHVITDPLGAMSADIRSGLAANTGAWGRTIDGAGRLITKTLNDDGTDGQTAHYIERTGNAVTAHRTLVGGVDKLTVSADGAHLALSGSATPAVNGELVFQATSNTSLTFKYRGSDGVTRTASVTLA
jgi:hypothetical protein